MYEIYERLLHIKGVTTADVCKATGISQSTMSNWKSRRNLLSGKNAKLVAEYFGVSVDYLMTGEESKGDESAYYLNPETAKYAQAVYDDPDLRMLFDAARGTKPEAIRQAAEMLKLFKETNKD